MLKRRRTPRGGAGGADRALAELAELWGVATSYVDAGGAVRTASSPALLAVLRSLGAPLATAGDAVDAVRERRRTLAGRICEPVTVVWDADVPELRLWSDTGGGDRYRVVLSCEDGAESTIEGRLTDLPAVASRVVDGVPSVARRLTLTAPVSHGYHTVRLDVGARTEDVALFRAPRLTWQPDSSGHWGLFAPGYALHTERGLAGGDFTDLEHLVDWTATQGGTCVATLPLLASFLEEPFEPSPYSPASRLFWNELYLDPERVPELARSPAARALLASAGFREQAAALRAAERIDYKGRMRLERRLFAELARTYFDGTPDDAFAAWLQRTPRATDYARFRATLDRLGRPWPEWPERLRSGDLQPGDYAEEDSRYHLYVQWRTSEQIERVAGKARSLGLGLYLDLPLGVHAAAYDTWRERDLFLVGCSAGSPPDPVFTKGQVWGLAPLHPDAARRTAHRYFAEIVRHHLRCAGALRIDHVMGLHRLYCIPEGEDASRGAYLQYRADEQYAVLAIESHRHRAMLIGEDLGTVPPEVRERMTAHGIHRMHILEYEMEGGAPFAPPPAETCASINTHDMPPFAAWWAGEDIDDRLDLGLLDGAGAEHQRQARRAATEAVRSRLRSLGRIGDDAAVLDVLRAILVEFAASDAALVVVSLEDLWLERQPQNVPGTGRERPNWRRRFRHPLPDITGLASVREILAAVSTARKRDKEAP